jgi:predicted AlkP superfamily phosphohydrolase/phosphomutase
MRLRIELGIRLNPVGREPSGTVPREEYEVVRDRLGAALTAVTTPDGDPVFSGVYPRETVYDGPYTEQAPDIVLVPADFEHFLSGSLRDDQFGPPSEPWNHKRTGVIVATGADIDTEASVTDYQPNLFDIAPTVLSTLGVAPSDRMDGQPLPVVEPLASQSYPEFNARELQTADSDTVEQHLANLGYLEDV